MAKRTAVIDIGSNSVRMVVYEKTSRFAFHLLHEEKSRVRISEHAYQNHSNLQDAAIQRAVDALRDFLNIAASYKVRKTLCVATSAVRDARNKKIFLSRVKDELGLKIRVIDGIQEAYYGGIACANLLPKLSGVVVDIGGGSTECACIEAGKVVDTYSLNLGAVRLKELFFDHGDLEGATSYIDHALQALPLKKNHTLIGLGGTFRALSQAVMKADHYPLSKIHAYRFHAKELKHLGKKILKVDNKELKALHIKPERYDVIRPGVLILLRIMKHLKVNTMVASGVGVREGVYLCDILRSSNDCFPANYNPSVAYLQDTYSIDKKFSSLMVRLVHTLFDTLHPLLDIDHAYKPYLLTAAKLAKIGASIHFYSYHQHSYHLIQSALEYGYTHEEIILIATLARYQNKRGPSKSHYQRYEKLLPKETTLHRLTFLLSLCNVLLAHRPQSIDFSLELHENILYITPKKGTLHIAKERLLAISIPSPLKVVCR